MEKRFLSVLFTAVLVAGGCSSTFVVSKDGKGYHFGSNTQTLYTMLCESGDLQKVLSDTQLARELRDDLYRYNCSPERSGEKIKQIYVSMTPEQRKDLRSAFRKNGYDINLMPC